MGWRSWYWISALPPILIVVLFKVIFLRKFTNEFRWWIPSPNEIAASKVHSERADSKGGRLASRFGHPALHSDLFTPMLHAKMMPLLSQVYHGRLGTETKAMAEYSGQKMEAQIAPGGIRIAGISEVTSPIAVDHRDSSLTEFMYNTGGPCLRPGPISTRSRSTRLGQQVNVIVHDVDRRGFDHPWRTPCGIRRIYGQRSESRS